MGCFAHQHEYRSHPVAGGGNNDTDTNSGSSAGGSEVGGVGAGEGGAAHGGVGAARERTGERLGNLTAKASQGGLGLGKGTGWV